MQQDLSHLNDLIASIQEEEQSHNTQQLSQAALKEAHALKKHFLVHFIQQQGKQAVIWLVSVSQHITAIWLNQLHAQRKKRKSRNRYLEELEIKLAEFTDFLYRKFSDKFDQHQRIPLPLWEQKEEELERLWQHFIQLYREAIDPSLITLVRTVYHNTILEHRVLTYYETECWINWWRILPSDLTNSNPSANERMIQSQIRHNINHADIVAGILNRMAVQLEQETDGLHYWINHYRYIQRIPDLEKPGLVPGQHTCKKLLLQAIKKEMMISQQLQLRTNTPLENPEPIHTDLTSAQIALLTRLLVETGIYKTDNVSDVLKKVSRIYYTRHRETATPETLRTKYYSPDPATTKILRERLLHMINTLRHAEQSMVS